MGGGYRTILSERTMSRYRLVDQKTGLVIRHSIRTLREAERERVWYEENTGGEIRVIKVFPERRRTSP